MLKRVLPDQARVGMYVHSFDGNWLSHPFWRTRFVLENEGGVQKIREAGLPFHIDTALGLDVATPDGPGRPAASARPLPRPVGAPGRRAPAPAPRAPVSFGKANQDRAVETAKRTAAVVRDIFGQLRANTAIELDGIAAAVTDVAAALDHDPAIFLTATRLRAKSEQLYMHSVAVCALAMNLGTLIGLSPAANRELGIGALLHDIGKLSLPESVLGSTEPLDAADRAALRRHPEEGHATLLGIPDVPAAVLDICLNHHERMDGRGYPGGVPGEALTVAARVVAICNAFDGLTFSARGRKGLPPIEAVQAMAADTGAFDPALLFRFMQSVGAFAPGMLVRLRSNRLAVALPAERAAAGQRFRAFYATLDGSFIPYDDVLSAPGSMDGPVSPEVADKWLTGDWTDLRDRIERGAPHPAA